MSFRRKDTPSAAAAKASFSTATVYRIESDPQPPSQKQTPRTGRRSDPLGGIFDKEVVPLLVEFPSLRAVTIFDELCRRYPELPAGVRRTLERRVRRWRALHGPAQEVIFAQRNPPGRLGLSDFTATGHLGVTIAGAPLTHLLYHFRLPYSGFEYADVDSGRALPGIPANVTTESGQPYQRFRGKPSNFGWLPEWVVRMTGTDRRASASLNEQASGSHSSGEGEAMANERISMRKIRDIIRLREKGLGYRQIGRALRISHPVVSQYARDFAATGLSYAQIKGISDSDLMELLAGGRTADARYGALGAWFERCTRELKRVGVTIQQIWEEYRQEQPDGYGYSQFCYHLLPATRRFLVTCKPASVGGIRLARQGCRTLRASRRSGAPAARSGTATRNGGRRFPVPIGGGGMGADPDHSLDEDRFILLGVSLELSDLRGSGVAAGHVRRAMVTMCHAQGGRGAQHRVARRYRRCNSCWHSNSQFSRFGRELAGSVRISHHGIQSNSLLYNKLQRD